MLVSDVIVKCLESENVDVVFGYPGGAVLALYESLRKSDIEHVLVRQEQAAAHAASGYARATEKVGVCIATSGPGATNLITGIATAYMDSIPLVCITGQVNRELIGKDAFQEADITGATEPFTKHNYLVSDPEDIPKVLKEAFYIAKSGRPGPVLIDIPHDVQMEHIKYVYPENVDIIGYKPTVNGHAGQIRRTLNRIKKAKKPIIYAGGGVIRAGAQNELLNFAEGFQIPVVTTLMGIGSFPMDNKYYVGMSGFHGHSETEKIIGEADLIVVVGARLSDRATNNYRLIRKDLDVVHIDVDPAEIGKIVDNRIPVVGDARKILRKLVEKKEVIDSDGWLSRIDEIKNTFVSEEQMAFEKIEPRKVLDIVSQNISDQCIITADVGQNQMWAARGIKYSGKRKYFTSGGLGTMGYSLPAAIGVSKAVDTDVVAIMGDGSIQMSLGELGTISEHGKNVFIICFNNSRLGMVRELQDRWFGKGKNHGVEFPSQPEFVKIAEAYGIEGCKVDTVEGFEKCFSKWQSQKGVYFVEYTVHEDTSTI